ncbi:MULTISPECIES: NDP-hexose 2,3-dehydratase family protein [Actinomadura]|uniref:NDP-hexose 2,3-dehydratase family protein n=1 Tax=Actinomadura TaxID=1988 RepID=UPI000685918A|nr:MULTISPECIES: NDP-hexose 2,3-dehydratase family protein [Actinomadura]RSN70961.1 NDP-hexose 2,3-dehydratase [Actinomadura sp. WAC 06369]
MPKLTVGPSQGVRSAAEFTAWFDERRGAGSFEVTPIPFQETRGWGFDPDTGNLRHDSGRFFSVEGVSVRSELGPVTAWSQPIMVQPELGIVGIALRRTARGWEALMQAKMEPGNVNTLQLSPTVQATRSNYTRVHAGNSVKYLEYFTGQAPSRMLIDVLQSEQGSWFFRKRNRNMIVEVEGDVPADEDFRWVPLDVLYELLHEPNVLNMDSRSVMAHLPLVLPDRASGGIEGDGFRAALARSFAPDARPLHPVGDLLDWLTSAKARHTVTVERVPLRRVERWHRTDTTISHDEGRYFDVIAVNVEASTREVRGWTQPLLRPTGHGIVAFLARPIDGVLHVLVHAWVEPGYVDLLELSPTVHFNPGNYKDLPPEIRPPFLDYVQSADPGRVRYDVLLSEEGGRFHHAQNRYLVIEVGDEIDEIIGELDDYRWMTLHQLTGLLRHSHYLNMQARSLIACLRSMAPGPVPAGPAPAG